MCILPVYYSAENTEWRRVLPNMRQVVTRLYQLLNDNGLYRAVGHRGGAVWSSNLCDPYRARYTMQVRQALGFLPLTEFIYYLYI